MSAERSPDGRQARWDKHNQERREQILGAAIEVVEAGEPGAEFHVQQIAERAGLTRSVIYRHFTDRADLDRAIQAAILQNLTARLVPAVTLDGTVHEIIERAVSTYVGWAVDHPALHRFAENDAVGGPGPLQHGIHEIAAVLVEVLETAVVRLGLDLDEDDRALIDPLAYALVGAVFGSVRRWASREERRPAAAQLSTLLSASVWHIIDGHARWLGLELDPNLPVEQLLSPPVLTPPAVEVTQA